MNIQDLAISGQKQVTQRKGKDPASYNWRDLDSLSSVVKQNVVECCIVVRKNGCEGYGDQGLLSFFAKFLSSCPGLNLFHAPSERGKAVFDLQVQKAGEVYLYWRDFREEEEGL